MFPAFSWVLEEWLASRVFPLVTRVACQSVCPPSQGLTVGLADRSPERQEYGMERR